MTDCGLPLLVCQAERLDACGITRMTEAQPENLKLAGLASPIFLPRTFRLFEFPRYNFWDQFESTVDGGRGWTAEVRGS